MLAAATLPSNESLKRFLELAKLIEKLGRRQPPIAVIRIVHKRALYLPLGSALWLAVASFCSNAEYVEEGVRARKFT